MNSGKNLTFAIVGAGAVASHHLSALSQVPGAEIRSIVRRNAEKAREMAGKFHVNWTTRIEDVLEDPEIDVIDITLPSGLHADVGILAAQAGKHVVVEKPIDITLEKADALIEACEKQGVTLAVISQNRFTDDMLKLSDILKAGQLGQLIEGDAFVKWYRPQSYYDSGVWRGTWALDGGGAFMNQGIHFVDLLLSVMGPVATVSARTKTVAHRIEVEDLGVAMLEFKNGALGVIQASTAMYPGLPARLDIHGTRGTAIFEGNSLSFLHVEGLAPFLKERVDKGGAAAPMAISVTPFVREFEDIVSAIRDHRQPKVNGQEARRALQLVLAIYESSRTGKLIRL
ncbi:MAG: Gfo/Idh/MocA family oxidoreductase [Calditrichaeota bacterium]|nr:Gfo/Idh/MocA family oxidoreductase [Calditrichota bacterium]